MRNWCQQASKYNERSTTNDWRSIQPREHGFNAGTLRFLAQYALDAYWRCCGETESVVTLDSVSGSASLPLMSRTYLQLPAVRQQAVAVDRYAEQYLRPVQFNASVNTIVVDSAMGTGKTKQLIDLIRRQQYGTVLYVALRRVFADSVSAELNATLPGCVFVNYQDVTDAALRAAPYKVVQLESLERLQVDDTDLTSIAVPELLVLDEFESICMQLSNTKTLTGRRARAVQTLEYLIQRATHVYVADAYLSERSLYPILALRPQRGSVQLVVNTFKAMNRQAVMLQDKSLDKFYACIMAEINAGGKPFVVFASKSAAITFWQRHLKGTQIGHKFYHAVDKEERHTSDNYEDFGAVRQAWAGADVRCVICTPTVTVGVNFDVPHVFTKVYMATHPNSCCVRDLFRMRHVRDNLLILHVTKRCFGSIVPPQAARS